MRNISFFTAGIACMFILSLCNSRKTGSGEAAEAATTNQDLSVYRLDSAWSTPPDLKTPESVIYDAKRDQIYVSNVNENPWEKDGNGFISKLSASGQVEELEWVTGFSGPKGMAIVGDLLFVADLDEVGVIDLDKEELIEKIKLEGASGLNDITPDNNGGLFISDSNGGKIYRYADGGITVFHDNTPGRPNGVLVNGNQLLVAYSQTTEFCSFDIQSLDKKIIAAEIGAGDGVTPTNDRQLFLVSDWNGEIFLVNLDGGKRSLLKTKDQGKNTADIWFIAKDNLVLVPTFFDNRIVAYKLTVD